MIFNLDTLSELSSKRGEMAKQAVRDYNELIEKNSGLLHESHEFLVDRFKEVRFVFGGRILSPYLRPHFVTREEWSKIKSACELVWGAIENVGRKAPFDALMLEQLGMTDGERRLLSYDPGYNNVS